MSNARNLVIGYHGCEKQMAQDVLLNRARLSQSKNKYDWLGSGIYFWENDPVRALEFATEIKKCKEPFVLGAIFDLGYCLDLTCRDSLKMLNLVWENVVKPTYETGCIRENKPGKKGETGELVLRFLDCYVIEAVHKYNSDANLEEYDSVRGAFWEGDQIYPTAGFLTKNHIQICLRNYDCIVGFFLPQDKRFVL